MRWPAFAFLALAWPATPAVAHDAPLRELKTDRPDRTESPFTVDAGHWQLEMDAATWTRDRADGVRTETLAVAPFSLKYGVSADTDLQLLVEPYLRRTERDRATGARRRVAGFGDVTLRLKHNLIGNDGGKAALGLIPFVRLPTSRRDLGTGKVEGGVILPASFELSDTVELNAMTQVLAVEDKAGDYAADFVNSASLGFSLTDRLGVYTELYTERVAAAGEGWQVTGDTGVTYRLNDNLQIDAGVDVGLTRAADDLQVFAGVSRRF